MIHAARLHCLWYMWRHFRQAIADAEKLAFASSSKLINLKDKSGLEGCRVVLEHLAAVFGLTALEEHASVLVLARVLSAQSLGQIHAQLITLYSLLRPQVIALVDAFDVSDYVLNSTIGAYDGDVYRRILDKAHQSHPPVSGILQAHKYFGSVIKPVLEQGVRIASGHPPLPNVN